jgi:hypothetical protein
MPHSSGRSPTCCVVTTSSRVVNVDPILCQAAGEQFDVRQQVVDDAVGVVEQLSQVEAKLVVDRKGQLERKTAFSVRLANGTREIGDPVECQRSIAARWTAPAA